MRIVIPTGARHERAPSGQDGGIFNWRQDDKIPPLRSSLRLKALVGMTTLNDL
jgi:hypothetical protein